MAPLADRILVKPLEAETVRARSHGMSARTRTRSARSQNKPTFTCNGNMCYILVSLVREALHARARRCSALGTCLNMFVCARTMSRACAPAVPLALHTRSAGHATS